MDLGRAAVVIVITLALVVIINLAIYFSLRGGRTFKQIDLLRKATHRARRPWQDEDADLQELSRRVATLKGEAEIDPDEEQFEEA